MATGNKTTDVLDRTDVNSLGRLAIWCSTGLVGFVFLLFTSCSVLETYAEPDILREKVGVRQAEVQLSKARLELERQRLEAIRDLVEKGIDPVVARCGLEEEKNSAFFRNNNCSEMVIRLREIDAMAGRDPGSE